MADDDTMSDSELTFRTTQAFEDYLREIFPDAHVRRESPRTTTGEVWTGRLEPYGLQVGFTDAFLATIVNNRGYLTVAQVREIFRRGDVLSEIEARRGALVLISSINGEVVG